MTNHIKDSLTQGPLKSQCPRSWSRVVCSLRNSFGLQHQILRFNDGVSEWLLPTASELANIGQNRGISLDGSGTMIQFIAGAIPPMFCPRDEETRSLAE